MKNLFPSSKTSSTCARRNGSLLLLILFRLLISWEINTVSAFLLSSKAHHNRIYFSRLLGNKHSRVQKGGEEDVSGWERVFLEQNGPKSLKSRRLENPATDEKNRLRGTVEYDALDFFRSLGVSYSPPNRLPDIDPSISSEKSNFLLFGKRTKAKLAVQRLSRWGGIRIGLYRPGTHEVIDVSYLSDPLYGNTKADLIQNDPHHVNISKAVSIIKNVAINAGVAAYWINDLEKGSEKEQSTGELRYIQLCVERSSGKIQLTLVWNSENSKEAGASLSRFVKCLLAHKEIWHSLHVNFNTVSSNAIFNYNKKSWKHIYGPTATREKIGIGTFYFPPQVFRQSNLDLYEKTVLPSILKYIPTKKNVSIFEMYSGLGIIGVNAGHMASKVLCSDSNEFISPFAFDRGLSHLDPAISSKIEFVQAAAEDAVDLCRDFDLMVVNPPRKGLCPKVKSFLTNADEVHAINRIIYIACGFSSLKSDLCALIDSRLWKLQCAEGFNLFPESNGDHIEIVAVLDKIL